MDQARLDFESQIRECYGRVIYTHKTHERMADNYDAVHNFNKWLQIILAALTAVVANGNIFLDYPVLPYLTAILSIITLIIAGYAKEVNPGAIAQKHREAAAEIWHVRESYLSILTDLRDPAIFLETLRDCRDELQQQLSNLYHAAPHTNGKAYVEAQLRIQKMQDMTFSEAEIDKLLPPLFRRSERGSAKD